MFLYTQISKSTSTLGIEAAGLQLKATEKLQYLLVEGQNGLQGNLRDTSLRILTMLHDYILGVDVHSFNTDLTFLTI